MATTATVVTETSTPSSSTGGAVVPEEQHSTYGCEHIESILKKHGDRVRREYDAAMSVVVHSSSSTKGAKVKMCKDCNDPARKTMMCFSCDYVGCLRKGHISKHYRENKLHRLSIASDTGNVYCHACDDFIYDPTLEAIQQSKRTILGKRKRETDTLSSTTGSDTTEEDTSALLKTVQSLSSQTCKISGLRGIRNLGNTCYMSSILQSFMHNPIVRNHYLSDSHRTSQCKRQNCIHCTITTVFSNMYTSHRPDPSIAYGPTDFISTVWKIDTTFAGTDQQDSHEFLMFMLNCMHNHHTQELTLANGVDEKNCKCLAHQVFGGESQSEIKCIGCGNVNRKVELMFDIGLQIRGKSKVSLLAGPTNGKNGSSKASPISPSSSAGSSDIGDTSTGQTLQDCLDKYTAPEHLDQNQYRCSNCSTSKGATKQMSIKVLPNVLCLQFKRFDGRLAKVDEHVRFPPILDMAPYTSHGIAKTPDKRDCTYDLFAVVSHIGANIHKGHYINFAKFNGEWFEFNDHIVEWVSQEQVLRSKAYLCFYIKHSLEYEFDETLKDQA